MALIPRSDLRAPFAFRLRGRLKLPSGITTGAGCSGRVSLKVKRGLTVIAKREMSLADDCTYSWRVSFANRRRFRLSTQLRFSARFLGNSLVLPVSATVRSGHVRR